LKKCLFCPEKGSIERAKGSIERAKGSIDPRVYGRYYRGAAASRAAHVRQPCSARAWDEKQTRPFEESQTKTSPSLPSRQEEHTFVVRTPHTTQFLCARNACSLPSLSILLFLVGVVWAPMPDVGVCWPGTLPPVRARSRQNQSHCQRARGQAPVMSRSATTTFLVAFNGTTRNLAVTSPSFPFYKLCGSSLNALSLPRLTL
jgi:hypothetical protein